MKEAALSRMLLTPAVALCCVLVALAALGLYFFSGQTLPFLPDSGFILSEMGERPVGWAGAFFSVGLYAFIGLGISALDTSLNFLRSRTRLYIAFFALMSAATPELTLQFTSAPMLALIILASALLLFNEYKNGSSSQRRVFTVFMMFSALSCIQYAFALFVPVLLIWCVQLRIANTRTFIAAFLGLLTPWWILFGLGIIKPDYILLPQISIASLEIEVQTLLPLLANAALSAIVLLICMILNFFKTIAYNARTRAMNGAVSLAGIAAVILMFVDFEEFYIFIPLLNACTALQCAHFFVSHQSERSYIGVALIAAAYMILYLWQILI